MSTFVRADRALAEARAARVTWVFDVTSVGPNPSTSQLVGSTDRLDTVLHAYDVAIQHLRVSGYARPRADAVLGSIRSMEDDLSPPASPSRSTVAGLTERAQSDWTRVIAASNALLAVT